MCVLQPCANPTQEGVWWRDDRQWCLYNGTHQALIRRGVAKNLQQIDLGTIESKVHPKGAHYVVNLKAMEQIAQSSGQRRPVMVIDSVSVQTVEADEPPQTTLVPRKPARSSPLNLNLRLHYRNSDGNMVQYDSDIEDAILDVMGSGSQRTLLMPDGRSGYYFFDLEAMEQRFVSHIVNGQPVFSPKAPLQIVAEVPWDATAMVSIAAKADKCVRRKILVMVVERFRSKGHLDAVLPIKARPRKIVSNSASTCSAALYEKFVDSVEIALERFPGDIVGDVLRHAGTKEFVGGPLQLAFRPVNRLKLGRSSSSKSADETKKCKAAFWISMAAPVAAAHAVTYGCVVQLKVLAYLVILPFSAWKTCAQTVSCERSGYVEVDRPEHGLPLAEVTVR